MSLELYSSPVILSSFPHPGVLLLLLNRAPVNALNNFLWAEIGRLFDVASADDEVRCVVFGSNVERAFSAGLDLHDAELEMKAADPARTALLLKAHIKSLQDSVSALHRCHKPVLCAAHGITLGGAIDLMAAADVRYCSSNTTFAIAEVNVGLAADVGSLARLPRKVGNDSLLRELALTARNFNAQEARELGLVSRVVEGGREEVIQAAVETARLIAGKSPVATLATKQFLDYALDHTTQDSLDHAQFWNMAMLQADDVRAAIAGFVQKKPPTFKKLGKL